MIAFISSSSSLLVVHDFIVAAIILEEWSSVIVAVTIAFVRLPLTALVLFVFMYSDLMVLACIPNQAVSGNLPINTDDHR